MMRERSSLGQQMPSATQNPHAGPLALYRCQCQSLSQTLTVLPPPPSRAGEGVLGWGRVGGGPRQTPGGRRWPEGWE